MAMAKTMKDAINDPENAIARACKSGDSAMYGSLLMALSAIIGTEAIPGKVVNIFNFPVFIRLILSGDKMYIPWPSLKSSHRSCRQMWVWAGRVHSESSCPKWHVT